MTRKPTDLTDYEWALLVLVEKASDFCRAAHAVAKLTADVPSSGGESARRTVETLREILGRALVVCPGLRDVFDVPIVYER